MGLTSVRKPSSSCRESGVFILSGFPVFSHLDDHSTLAPYAGNFCSIKLLSGNQGLSWNLQPKLPVHATNEIFLKLDFVYFYSV